MKELLKYSLNYYSQSGEDGILEEIFKRLNINTGWYVDIGSHNGIDISNTHYLREKGWNGICIEGDIDKYTNLLSNVKKYPNTICLNKIILPNELDIILKKYKSLPYDFDYLDIDIDSYDYYIWKNLKNYCPKIVQMEIIASVPLGQKQIHTNEKPLTSFTSMLELGLLKGYTLVCYTGLNMIFIRNDLSNIIDIEEKNNPNKQIYFYKHMGKLRELVNQKSVIQKKLEKLLKEI